MQLTLNNKMLIVLITLLTSFALMCGLVSGNAAADPDPSGSSTIEIAHITDVHYFTYDDCYNVADTTSEAYKATEFYKSVAGDTKLINQAGTLLSATINSIIAENPDYLIVSGDITRDGELRAHYDVANALRYLQNRIRTMEGGKPNFQIFVVPGNHDLYNSNASIYDAEGDKITEESNRTTSEAFSVIYNGLGYTALDNSGLSSTDAGIKMLNYFNTIETDQPHPLTSEYIYTTTASNLNIKYFSLVTGFPTATEQCVNCLSYVATTTDDTNYSFVMFDSTVRELSETSGLYWEHLTGGRINKACLDWAETNTENARADKYTLVGVAHHNFAPHYTMEENFTTDFVLYNWEDTSSAIADDIGIRYAFSGHMHAIDETQYVTYNGNVLYDFETGSLVSLKSPTRFTKITRTLTEGVLSEDVYSATVALNTLNGVYSTYINETTNANAVCLFNDVTDLEYFIGNEIYDLMVQRLLDSFVTDGLRTSLKDMLTDLDLAALLNKSSFTKGFVGAAGGIMLMADKLIDDIFLNLDYNISGIEADNLIDFIHGLLNSDKVLGIVVWQEGEEVYTAEQVLIWAYKCHIAGNEPATLDGQTALSRAAINLVKLMNNGTFMETFLNGILKPLLLDNNSLLEQIINHKVDLSTYTEAEDIEAVTDMLELIFNSAEDYPEIFSTRKVSLNDIITSNLVVSLLPLVGGLLPDYSSIIDMVIEAVNVGVIDWGRDFINKYMTDSFFTSLGGLLSEALLSFSTDSTADGASVIFGVDLSDYKNNAAWTHVTNGATAYGNLTFNGSALTLAQNQPTYEDGRLPSILTSTFGDDPATSQNFKWYSNHQIGGEFQYRAAGTSEWLTVVGADERYSVETVAIAYPLIDLGLFATKSDTTYEIEKEEYEYTLEDRENAAESSVKFRNVHSVSLTGLTANTTYEYRVISTYMDQEYCLQDYVVEGENKYYTFKTALTAGDESDYTFLAFSDIQGTILSSYEEAYEALTAAKTVSNYSFLVNCGDLVDSGSNIKQWTYEQNTLSSIFGNTSTVIAAGNHDDSDYALTRYYNFGNIGTQDTKTGAYYSYNYGRVHFIVLNTNDIKSGVGLADTQLAWLNEDLANRPANVDFTVVIMHKGLYSVGSHTTDTDVVALRNQLTPLFYANKVNLVLQGHDHTFSTTQLLDGEGKVVKAATTTAAGISLGNEFEGVMYMTLGTIADKFYEYRSNSEIESKLNSEQTIYQMIDSPTFASIDITSGGLTVNTYAYTDLDGNGTREVVSLSAYKAHIEPAEVVDGKNYKTASIIIIAADFALLIALAVVIIKKSVLA